ncbi:hypothetical protein [Streptomyces sp. NRRL F-2664]|uniref:hypothetical protein n=1 Tax=Streptomyces sp. NRRL F-2664 TaxID=1463842 RepID=UPI0004C87F21|nr:hypothetical protein [Streptomyces sp. NRRL F-2664]
MTDGPHEPAPRDTGALTFLRVLVMPSPAASVSAHGRSGAPETTAVRVSSLLPPGWRATVQFFAVGFSLAVVLPEATAAEAVTEELRRLWQDPGLVGWEWLLDPEDTPAR